MTRSLPWKAIASAALYAFPIAMVGLGCVMAVQMAFELSNGADFLVSLLYALVMAVGFVIFSPLFVPLFLVIVPIVALIPLGALAMSYTFYRLDWTSRPLHVALWVIAWAALFAVAISSGKISV